MKETLLGNCVSILYENYIWFSESTLRNRNNCTITEIITQLKVYYELWRTIRGAIISRSTKERDVIGVSSPMLSGGERTLSSFTTAT